MCSEKPNAGPAFFSAFLQHAAPTDQLDAALILGFKPNCLATTGAKGRRLEYRPRAGLCALDARPDLQRPMTRFETVP